MTWQTLALELNKNGAYVPLPLDGEGGRIPIEVSSFPLSEAGTYEAGIYSLPVAGDPALVAPAQTCLIARYRRHLIFEIPPNVDSPHLGVRLLSHEALDSKKLPITVRWQKPFGSGSGGGGGGTVVIPPPQGLVIAATLDQVAAKVDERKSVQIQGLEATLFEAIEAISLPDPDLVNLFNVLLS